MNIYWHGQTFFRIESGGSSLLVDPFESAEGLKPTKMEATVVLFSRSRDEFIRPKKFKVWPAQPLVIDGPGEYDVNNFSILGLNGPTASTKASDSSLIYVIEAEGIRLGHITEEKLNSSQLDHLANIDILMIAVSSDGLGGGEAAKITNEIEPRIVIPMNFTVGGKYRLEKPNVFLKEMGVGNIEPQNKLAIRAKDLPQEETKVVVLNNI